MKSKFLLQITSLLLIFIPFNSYSNNFSENYYYCRQIPEGSPFGLVFNKNMVTQIGVENLSKIQDYSEPYTKFSQTLKWLNVTLILNKLTLHLGSQKNNFAQCQKIETILELNDLLESFINSEKNKSTI